MPVKAEIWQERQAAIRTLLRDESIANQTELLARLRQLGLSATQSSVSRDLREMRVAKVDGHYILPDQLGLTPPATTDGADVFGHVVAVKVAGPHLLVVQTTPGGASAVGLAVDNARWSEVVGTVAGDDTLFVATQSRRDQAIVHARLQQWMEKRTDE